MATIRRFLTNYVKSGENKGRKYISDIPKQTVSGKETIVYRGQTGNTILLDRKDSFISTSMDDDVASGYGDILFKIHLLPGIRYIDINTLFENESMNNPYEKEKEILVFGGGVFCKREDRDGYIELWYAPSCLENVVKNGKNTRRVISNTPINWDKILQQARNEGYNAILEDLPNNSSLLTNAQKDELAILFGLKLKGGRRRKTKKNKNKNKRLRVRFTRKLVLRK
jgi:hypothetical protein